MAVISIIYKEPNVGTYDGVELRLINGEKHLFNLGDFIADWYYAKKTFIEIYQHSPEPLSGSSSIDHFIMDGAPYQSGYLIIDTDNEPVLKYLNDEITKWSENDYYVLDNGWEMFVPQNIKMSWEELKIHSKNVYEKYDRKREEIRN